MMSKVNKLVVPGSLQWLTTQADHSWLRFLKPDPETEANFPNRKSREVKSGKDENVF